MRIKRNREIDQKLYYSLPVMILVLTLTQHLEAGSTLSAIHLRTHSSPPTINDGSIIITPILELRKLCLTGEESGRRIYFIVSTECDFTLMLFSYHNKKCFLSLEQTPSHTPPTLELDVPGIPKYCGEARIKSVGLR